MTMLFNICLGVCFGSLLVSAIALCSSRRMFERLAMALLVVGVLAQTAYMILRWIHAGRAPFSNMFESLVLFSWSIGIVYLAFSIRTRLKVLAAAVSLFMVLALAFASTFGSDIKPLMPALQSNWLTFHVSSCFLGYAGFAISFIAAIGYLVAICPGRKVKPETIDALELITDKTISFGFLFLTIGIITGSVWANSAWGSYWSWDPKETWSLITWFVYAVFLHCRFIRGWHGKKTACISIAGFLSVLFTYFGVNFLIASMHSYAQ
ncbi:c-type cytochrome biogenesis protein CcsB [Verrucomicrobiota bacterium]